ncbi:MAG: acyl-CoA dehydrogenase [Legionellales bacterium]|jgi:acyl-CoA dehydrogenase|nr:acyl-CoA dehydrogenase [Legionellales bacterium]
MSTLITLVIFYILIITAGAINASLLSSIIMLTMFTLISFFCGYIGTITTSILLVLTLGVFLIFGITAVRLAIFSKPLYKFAKRHTKALSNTEKTALNAGDNWLEADIFQGKLDFDKILKSKTSTLSTVEQSFLDNETSQLCSLLDDWKIMHTDKDLSPAAWQFIKDKGFLGLVIASEYGGKGFSAAAHSAVVKKIATKSITAAITVMVPNSLGPGELLTNYGTDKQKADMLPKLASGADIPCFGLTGTYAGSDAASMPDIGVVCDMGDMGDNKLGIKLNFAKRYITLAPVATLIGLAFKLEDPDNLLNSIGSEGISLCLIPSNHPGIEIGDRHLAMGIPFMNGPINGKDVIIPIDWIIGGQARAGSGWQMLVECLAIGRSISLPAVCDAYNSNTVLLTSAYAALREQFNNPIVNFEGVAAKLGVMAGFSYMSRATRLTTLTAVDKNLKPAVASAIAKYHLTEISRKVINHAMDIHGGKAIMSGKHNYMATAYQGLPICITVEGANILTRNLIIFGQGAIKSHPYIYKELLLLNSNDSTAPQEFDAIISAHLAYLFRNWTKHGVQVFTAGRFAPSPHSKLSKSYKQIYRMSTAYAALADFALINLGSGLKRHERESARLGDIMSHLYMALATLKYYHDHGELQQEYYLAKWSVDYCLFEAQSAIINFCGNYPNKFIGKILRMKMFPWGLPYKKPTDSMEHEIAKLITYNEKIRASFTSGVSDFNDSDDGTTDLANAYKQLISTRPILAKLKKLSATHKLINSSDNKIRIDYAYKKQLITKDEHEALIHFEIMRDRVIAVDIFNHNFHPTKKKQQIA